MKKAIIVAVDEKWGIGKNGVLPWHIPEDLKRFKSLTKNSICIMGYNTYKEIADRFNYVETRKFLPFRHSVVITKKFIPHSGVWNDDIKKDGVVVSAKTITEALEKVSHRPEDVFFLGGGGIFKEAIDIVDTVEFTYVTGDFNCDTFFPVTVDMLDNIVIPKPDAFTTDEHDNRYCFHTVKNNWSV